MVVIIELERRVANTCILGINLGEFSHQKELSPIILFIIDKNPEVGLYRKVLPLSLAINLKVESSRKPLLNFKKVV